MVGHSAAVAAAETASSSSTAHATADEAPWGWGSFVVEVGGSWLLAVAFYACGRDLDNLQPLGLRADNRAVWIQLPLATVQTALAASASLPSAFIMAPWLVAPWRLAQLNLLAGCLVPFLVDERQFRRAAPVANLVLARRALSRLVRAAHFWPALSLVLVRLWSFYAVKHMLLGSSRALGLIASFFKLLVLLCIAGAAALLLCCCCCCCGRGRR